jgi:lysophospholipid acyltransferase
MGGFITTAARLARTNIRPLLLPKDGEKPSGWKELYDLLGTLLSTAILNYAASPFMLLTASSSLTTWSRLGYYGHVIIGGGLVFFYAGGTKFFKRLQAERGIVAPARGAATPGGGSGANTPTVEKNFTMPPTFDKIVSPQK